MAGLLVVLCGAIAVDQLAGSNDWRRFDRRTVTVLEVVRADEIVLDDQTTVRLIGVDGPYDQSLEYAKARLKTGQMTLKLEPTQTRDADGRLLAYAYLSDKECLNHSMIRDGKAFADRRVKHTYSPQYEQAETDARKKGRGIWKDLKESDMPAWRREWLEQLRKDRAATSRRS